MTGHQSPVAYVEAKQPSDYVCYRAPRLFAGNSDLETSCLAHIGIGQSASQTFVPSVGETPYSALLLIHAGIGLLCCEYGYPLSAAERWVDGCLLRMLTLSVVRREGNRGTSL